MRSNALLTSSYLWLAVIVGGMALPLQAATLYVSPDGDDRNQGTLPAATGIRGPMATLGAALRKMRSVAPTDAIADRIVLLPGNYVLKETVRLWAEDSGTEAAPLIIEPLVSGTVTLSGARQISSLRQVGEEWRAAVDLPRGFHMLWVDGKRAPRARSPNGKTFFVGGANVRTPVPEQRPFRLTHQDNFENTRAVVLPDAARAELGKAQSAGGLQGVSLIAMHSWTASNQIINSYDSTTGVASVSPDSIWPFFRFGPAQRFALENHPSFLDEPGEWWLSAEGEFRYRPHSGESIEHSTVYAPQLETLMAFSGIAERPVNNVVLKGLRFAHSAAWATPFIDSQAAIKAPTALLADYANNILIDDCSFENIGGYAVWFRYGVRNSAIKRSLFRDMGAGGIRIGSSALSKTPASRTESNVVEHNFITGTGQTFPGGIGIWIGQSALNRVANNELGNLNYSGISVGWTWGFGTSEARQNLIESNYIHDVGQGFLSDLGGVYTLGRTEGMVIRGNRIEDVYSFLETGGATAWGIYLDEGSSDVLVEKNVVLRTAGGGFHLHYGRDDIIRNNIFGFGRVGGVKRTAKGENSKILFEKNVVVAEGGPIYYGEWEDATVVARSNVLFRKDVPFEYRGQSLSRLAQKGLELGSVSSDPQLVCKAGRCDISQGVADSVGFENFSTAAAGIGSRGSFVARCLADPACSQ
jgi:hypothetical protein